MLPSSIVKNQHWLSDQCFSIGQASFRRYCRQILRFAILKLEMLESANATTGAAKATADLNGPVKGWLNRQTWKVIRIWYSTIR